MVLVERHGLPIALLGALPPPHESTLVEATLAACVVPTPPPRVVGDGAYDNDPLDARLAQQGVELIARHRRDRTKPPTQAAAPLVLLGERWKIERLFAWLRNFRRLVVRYERKAANYVGLVQLACCLILLRYRL